MNNQRGLISLEDATNNSSKFDTVFLIDMQESNLKRIDPQKRESMIKAQLEVIEHCDNYHIPIIVLEYLKGGTTIDKLERRIHKIPRHRRKLLIKSENDGFIGKSRKKLLKKLKKYQTNSIYLMGVNASACVKQTGEGAKRERFSVMSSEDVIADPPNWQNDRAYATENGALWFKENGIFVPRYTELTLN